MKSKLVILAALVLAGSALTSQQQRPSGRMQLLGMQKYANTTFEFWHDTDTGQEVICISGSFNNAESCYLSGRTWK